MPAGPLSLGHSHRSPSYQVLDLRGPRGVDTGGQGGQPREPGYSSRRGSPGPQNRRRQEAGRQRGWAGRSSLPPSCAERPRCLAHSFGDPDADALPSPHPTVSRITSIAEANTSWRFVPAATGQWPQ